jgi:ubiquitin carboxyl-terminal hydrolase 7
MQDLVDQIAGDIEQDPKRVRLWIMVNRQNKTIRPDQPVMDLRPTIEETYNRAAAHRDQALRVWVEVAEEVNAEGAAVWPTYGPGLANGVVVKNDLILLFLKWFDAEAQALKGVGHVYISKEKKVEELIPTIMKKMSWDKLPSDERIQLWEVRRMIRKFTAQAEKLTLAGNQTQYDRGPQRQAVS